jgi:hypothetical protein
MSDVLEVVVDELMMPGGHLDRRQVALAVSDRLNDLLADPLTSGLPLDHRGDDAAIRVQAASACADRLTDPAGLASELARAIMLAILGGER